MHVREDRKADQQKRLIGFSVCESHHDQSEVGIDARPKIAVALEAGATLAGANAVIDEARADARNRLGLSGARAGRRVEGVECVDAGGAGHAQAAFAEEDADARDEAPGREGEVAAAGARGVREISRVFGEPAHLRKKRALLKNLPNQS